MGWLADWYFTFSVQHFLNIPLLSKAVFLFSLLGPSDLLTGSLTKICFAYSPTTLLAVCWNTTIKHPLSRCFHFNTLLSCQSDIFFFKRDCKLWESCLSFPFLRLQGLHQTVISLNKQAAPSFTQRLSGKAWCDHKAPFPVSAHEKRRDSSQLDLDS